MVVRQLFAVLLAAVALCAAPAASAADSGDIVVVSAKGEVFFTVSGEARVVLAGGVLVPPATLRTGRDGSVDLKQGATTVSVGPETTLHFPALEKHGAPIDRIEQPAGNAFYDVGKRSGRKLRVETPYLVAVIKGTQFNVAAQADGATISLFEGLLEIRAPDDSAVVDLKAGEIASRKRGEKTISIIQMEGGKLPPASPRPSGSGKDTGVGAPAPSAPRADPANDGETLLAGLDESLAPRVPDLLDSGRSTSGPSVAAEVDLRGGGDVAVDANTSVAAGVGDMLEVAANAAIGLDDNVDAGLSAGASVGSAVNVDADVQLSAAPGGIDVDAGANLGVGAATISVDTGAEMDLGSPAIDASASAALDAGPVDVSVDVGLDAAVDVAAGSIDAGADTAIEAGPITADVGAGAAVDIGAGTVDLGVSIAGVDLDLGVDLGLDDSDVGAPDTSDTDPGTDTTDTGTVVDVGGLLDSLLRRPGRR